MKVFNPRFGTGVSFVLFSLAIVLSCCRNNHKFYREKEVFHFLETKKVNLTSENSILLLLVGSSCETCLDATKYILKSISDGQIQNLIVILGDDLAREEYSPIITNSSRVTILNTNVDTLSTKGLLLQGDGIFFIHRTNQITKLWSITLQNKSKILNEIRKKKYQHY